MCRFAAFPLNDLNHLNVFVIMFWFGLDWLDCELSTLWRMDSWTILKTICLFKLLQDVLKRCSHLSPRSDRSDVCHRWTSPVSPLCSRTGQRLTLSRWVWSERHPLHPVGPVTDTCWNLWFLVSLHVRLWRQAGRCSLSLVSDPVPSTPTAVCRTCCHIYTTEWRSDLFDQRLCCCIRWLWAQRRL